MTRVFRVALRVVAWGLLGLLALVLIVFAINARDEDLSPETQALLQVPQNPYGPEQNIYVALAGFEAPAGESVVTTGQARIARYNRHVDDSLRDPFYELQNPAPADPKALTFAGKADCESPRDYAFWACVRDNRSRVIALLAANRELLERYQALQHLPGYFETERASTMMDVIAPPSELRTLFLARFASVMQTGDAAQRQGAMAELGGDMDLWRRVLAGEGNLLSKMLAIAYLQNDYLMLSDMIADPHVPIPDNIDFYLRNSPAGEWTIAKAFSAEFRFHSFIARQAKELGRSGWEPQDEAHSRVGWWFIRNVWGPIGNWFFKINATENLDARIMNRLAQFAAMEPTAFLAQRARYKAWEDEQANFLKLRSIYNPTGRVLLAIAVPAYENYLLRPYDAAALQRLTLLSLEIRRKQVALSAVPEFMKSHPELSTHPVDGSPFRWNATDGEVAIHTLAHYPSNRRFSVRIWRKPGD